MPRIEFKERRIELKTALENYHICMQRRREEIEKMAREAAAVEIRLSSLDRLEAGYNERRLLELVRMCNTPVWCYQAREVC
jgi:molecular chaperone GrpE (heat shock protein)